MKDDYDAALWASIEPLVQAAITRRLIQFHDALVSREQIELPEVQVHEIEAASDADLGAPAADEVPDLGKRH